MFSRSTTIDCTAPSTRPSALESASTPVVTARSASTAAALIVCSLARTGGGSSASARPMPCSTASMSRCTSRATSRRAARSSSVSSLTSCAATWSVARRPNWRNASRTRSRSASAPCSRNSSCARANQVAAEPACCALERPLALADEVAVGEVGLGELARQVVGGDEIDGAAERGLGRLHVVLRRRRSPTTRSAAASTPAPPAALARARPRA